MLETMLDCWMKIERYTKNYLEYTRKLDELILVWFATGNLMKRTRLDRLKRERLIEKETQAS